MENTIIFSMPDCISLAERLSAKLQLNMGLVEIRTFPDAESYVRIQSDVKNKTIVLVCALDHPNPKILTLMFLAKTLKELGAKRICLVAPYLPYMRLDKQFNPGEAVTSVLFAKFLSGWIDALITIDPHLHRIRHLSDIYTIHAISVLHATKAIAEWIRQTITSPLLIGPDEESRQWVTDIAKRINAPYVICQKIRHGDRNVSVTIPELKQNSGIPVLVDDIISTGSSLIAILKQITLRGFDNTICIGVHPLFNDDTHKAILDAGAKKIISCNTIIHPSNTIDITDVLVEGIKEIG